jgi:transposase
LRNLRKIVILDGSSNLVYLDESGFEEYIDRPSYSPDFNCIEQDFAILKKRRIYSAPGTSLDDIVKSYGNYLE